jgi:hypothetical protein
MQRASAILSSVFCTFLTYFSTLSHKWHDFSKEKLVTDYKMCVLIFCANFSDILLVLRRTERSMIKKMYIGLHVKYQLFLSHFN